jgi:putative sigma-54 modulation protein
METAMRITYTGRQVELAPAQVRKLEAQFSKLGKLLDGGRHECEARVILSHERHLHKSEVTVKYHDHSLVGLGEDSDLFTSIHGAITRLEKQAVKVRVKWRDSKRVSRKEAAPIEAEETPARRAPSTKQEGKAVTRRNGVPANAKLPGATRVRRVAEHVDRKPMTLDEAMLEIEGRDYLAFQDSESGSFNVLVRRRDGHFDLLES